MWGYFWTGVQFSSPPPLISNAHNLCAFFKEELMKNYISKKNFYTKGIYQDKIILMGVIPGLTFVIQKKENDLYFLSNVSTKSVIIVTEDMLFSELFVEK